ncbi:Acyl-CoA-binding protein, ACBP [Corchorus olitorius]|uniref:Acyl-CoA-binding protein, ACBP n=1 Tax=Corchorus olitorius TaxID=93759 RepID=A0A1R3HKA3_9ROSI|nr:Acyl-CoA-binding protein, ACBP [Corchorus olitorius]
MEIILELFLTAFVAVLFSFFIAKIVSSAMGGSANDGSASGVEEKSLIDDVNDGIIMEELEFSEKLKVQGFESDKKVEFVKESADNKVDVYGTEESRVDQGNHQVFDSEKIIECVGETAESDKVDEREGLNVQGFVSEKDVEFSPEIVNKVDNFETEQHKIDETEAEVKLDDDADVVIEEKMEEKEVEEVGEELEAGNETKLQSEETEVEESQKEGVGEEEKEVKLESDNDDDDWEGIERSELEKAFGAAAKFVEHKGELEGVGNDVQMELYGLHKIATEGPCREPQPLAFMVSARSKWNAWQRLGNMNPDAAMEQYVALVSDRVPGWMEDNSDGEHRFKSADSGVPGAMAPDITSFPNQLSDFTPERDAELRSASVGGEITEGTISEKQAKD